MVKISCQPISIPIKEKRWPKKTKWEEYKEITRKFVPYYLQWKNVEEIERAVDKLTEVISTAIDRCVPKIRSRTLPHPEIYQETRYMMDETKGIKIQMVNEVHYVNNRLS